MTLQSQAPRVQSWRSTSSGNSWYALTPRTRVLIAGAGLALVALTAYMLFRSSPAPVTDLPGGTVYSPAADGGINATTITESLTAEPAKLAAPTNPGTTTINTIPAANTANLPASPNLSAQNPTTPPAPTNPPIAPNGPGAGTTTGPAPTNPPAAPAASTGARALVEQAQKSAAAGNRIEARTTLNTALWDTSLTKDDRSAIRQQIAALNDDLFFGPIVAKGDTLSDYYLFKQGDLLVRLPYKQSIPVDYRLLQRINRIADAGKMNIGQRVKIIRVPIHAIVHKRDFRMDLYAGAPITAGSPGKVGPDGQEEGWTYIRSFPVGLGESDGTPEGLFIVRPKSKLINPRWINPRTGEVFAATDPKNPIGEHWIGLDGADNNTKRFTGYGIHGTIDPGSIGQQRSMGCVRMHADDVAMVWEMLVDQVSSVKIIE